MLSHIFFDQNRIYIRITVFTQMSASIIGTYICPQKARTFPISLIFLSLWNFQSAMESYSSFRTSPISSFFRTILLYLSTQSKNAALCAESGLFEGVFQVLQNMHCILPHEPAYLYNLLVFSAPLSLFLHS